MKRVHEGLNNYIKSLKTAGDVDAPGLQPRLPLGPDGAIPVGLRPLPSSSQAPKKTNATIVYARTAMNSTREDVMGEVRVADVGGVAIPIEEGTLVFTLRCAPATTAPLGQNVKTFSLSRVNHILEQEQRLEDDDSKRTHDKWSPDGVCNNLDGEDPCGEFKDFAIANVATQGFVRFSTLGMDDRIANADRIFVGLWQVDNLWLFERFTSHQITTSSAPTITINKKPFKWENLRKAWQVGRVVDGKQSKNMLTVNISIDRVAEEPLEEWPSMLVPDKDDPRKMTKQKVAIYSVEQQLKRMWLNSKNATELARIEADAAALLAASL